MMHTHRYIGCSACPLHVEETSMRDLIGRRELLKFGGITSVGSLLAPRSAMPFVQAGKRAGAPSGVDTAGLGPHRTLEALAPELSREPCAHGSPAAGARPAPGVRSSAQPFQVHRLFGMGRGRTPSGPVGTDPSRELRRGRALCHRGAGRVRRPPGGSGVRCGPPSEAARD
jgi:hypothetical protein